MGVTIYDIAEHASVSIATVSRVFNNHPRVSPKTRARVLAVAEKLHYQPNVSAQSLARQKSHLVSAVIPVLANYFYMEVMRGMQDALSESEFDLLVYTSPKPEEIDGQLARATQKGRAEGLLLLSTPLDEARVKNLKASRQPVVLVDAAHPDFDSISVDNVKGGYMATRHLIQQGYARIALVTVAPEPLPAMRRREGYEQALREAGRAVDPSFITASDRRPYGFVEEAGYEAMQSLLRRGERPDAVFVVSDIQAVGVLHALQEAGLRVPDDMAVIGFDGVEMSKYVGLSTLQQPMYEMGRLAIKKLLMRIQYPEHPTSHTVFSPTLILRSTCPARRQELPEGVGKMGR